MSNSPVLDCSDPEDRGSKLLQNSGNYLLTDRFKSQKTWIVTIRTSNFTLMRC